MIGETINRLKSELPPTVKLVAVSKFHPFDCILEAYHAGQRAFAESRPQELAEKVRTAAELRKDYLASGGDDPDYLNDIEWHFIGHLQTNKLKLVLPFVSLVQSVDSLHLLQAIDRWGKDNGKITEVLLECHVSSELSKQGFTKEELVSILSSGVRYHNIHIRGVMGMASFTDDMNTVRGDFSRLLEASDILQKRIGESQNLPSSPDSPEWNCTEISMGMSEDYPLAVEMGSTMVRIGSMIFGARQY